MTRPNAILLPVLLCLALPLAGCRDAGDSAMPSNEGPPPAASAAPTATLASGEADALTQVDLAGEQAAVDRKLIQNAELHLEVDNYEKARRALDAELGSLGGFVANAEVQHRDGDVSHAKLTLRIPSDKLHGFLGTAAGQGKVMHENLRTQDITDGYYDLQARLDNARKLETRLLALMTEKAHGMKELLELEREIARVREQIERHEGKLRLWDKQVAMSTVELSLLTKQVYTAAAPPTLSEKMGDPRQLVGRARRPRPWAVAPRHAARAVAVPARLDRARGARRLAATQAPHRALRRPERERDAHVPLGQVVVGEDAVEDRLAPAPSGRELGLVEGQSHRLSDLAAPWITTRVVEGHRLAFLGVRAENEPQAVGRHVDDVVPVAVALLTRVRVERVPTAAPERPHLVDATTTAIDVEERARLAGAPSGARAEPLRPFDGGVEASLDPRLHLFVQLVAEMVGDGDGFGD